MFFKNSVGDICDILVVNQLLNADDLKVLTIANDSDDS